MKTRVLTAIWALIIFIPFLIAGDKYFLFATLFLSALSIYEIVKISFGKLNKSILLLSFLVSIGVFFKKQIDNEILLLGFLTIVFLMLTEIVVSNHTVKIVDISTVIFLSFYVSIGFYSLYNIREIGLQILMFLLLTIWVTDSGAYIGGMKYGKRKLSPNISPNKSIEGSIIGTLSSIIVTIIFYFTIDLFTNFFIAIFITLFVSIVGQIGDLIESAYKREYKVKDSSNLLPGHGGIFDRFDSILLSAPLLLIIIDILKIY